MRFILRFQREILLGIIGAVLGGAALQFYLLSEDQAAYIAEQDAVIASLEANVSSTTERLAFADTTIAQQQARIADLEADKDDLRDNLRDEQNRNNEFEDQIRDIAGTVGTLDKLSKTDEELLQKYSKTYFLNENYIPSDLDQIDDRYVHDSKDDEYFHGDALSFLEDMLDRARRDGIDIEIISAYRSFDEQTELKGQFTQVYGEGANAFSADQGYSEHQLGTAVDFGTSEIANAREEFADTEAYEWLLENAYKYGFTLSYPEDNQFYIFEPWHWRFVGRELARDLNRADAHFYDWEQRKIDAYLISIFD